MLKILAMFFLSGGILISHPGTNESTLDSLISYALEVSPRLKLLEEKYNASVSRIEINSNLTDPVLTLGLTNLPTNSFSFTQEPMTGKIIGLSQAFPFPGKLKTVAEVNKKDAEIVVNEIADARNEIRKDLSSHYWELVFTRKAIQIAGESKRLLKDIAEVVRTNYSVSNASQQNILKVELEITNITDRIEELKNKENSLTAMINAQLLKSSISYVPTDELPDIRYLRLTDTELDSLARLHRPFLMGILTAKEKSARMEDLAGYDYYPNFNLSLQYSFRDKISRTNTPLDDFFTVMLGISLPLNYGGKNSAKVEEAKAMQNMYDGQYQLSLQMLSSSFGSSVSKLNSLQQRIKLIEEALLPQARQTYAASLSGYQVAQIDFINVIDAQNRLYQIETNLYRLKTDYLKEKSELEFLTGTELN